MSLAKSEINVFFNILRDNFLDDIFYDLLRGEPYQSICLDVVIDAATHQYRYRYNNRRLPYMIYLYKDEDGYWVLKTVNVRC